MNKKFVFLVFCILTSGFLIISCDDGSGNRNNHLVGTVWGIYDYSLGDLITLTFTSNNDVVFRLPDGRNSHGTYILAGNIATMDFPPFFIFEYMRFVGTISGNIMTITGTNWPESGSEFIRQ